MTALHPGNSGATPRRSVLTAVDRSRSLPLHVLDDILDPVRGGHCREEASADLARIDLSTLPSGLSVSHLSVESATLLLAAATELLQHTESRAKNQSIYP